MSNEVTGREILETARKLRGKDYKTLGTQKVLFFILAFLQFASLLLSLFLMIYYSSLFYLMIHAICPIIYFIDARHVRNYARYYGMLSEGLDVFITKPYTTILVLTSISATLAFFGGVFCGFDYPTPYIIFFQTFIGTPCCIMCLFELIAFINIFSVIPTKEHYEGRLAWAFTDEKDLDKPYTKMGVQEPAPAAEKKVENSSSSTLSDNAVPIVRPPPSIANVEFPNTGDSNISPMQPQVAPISPSGTTYPTVQQQTAPQIATPVLPPIISFDDNTLNPIPNGTINNNNDNSGNGSFSLLNLQIPYAAPVQYGATTQPPVVTQTEAPVYPPPMMQVPQVQSSPTATQFEAPKLVLSPMAGEPDLPVPNIGGDDNTF